MAASASPGQAPALALLVLLLLAAALPGAPVAAQSEGSLGVTPPSVEVADAQRGQRYQRHVTIQNQFDTPTVVTLEPLGEVGAWTTTDPLSGFEVPPRTDKVLNLTIAVPDDAPNGAHTGHMRVVAAPKAQPDGSGFALQYAVAVALNVTVGGEAVVKVRWLDAWARDVEDRSPPDVGARVVNEGNVRTTARVEAEVLPMDGETPVLRGSGAVEMVPGETRDVPLAFDGALGLGQYRARVRSVAPGGWEQVLEFKVLPPGSLGKDGLLRYLQHEPWVEAGLPVKVQAVFENTGQAAIGRAKFTGEATLDGTLVAVLASDELVVPVGKTVNLTAFFTPTRPGTYHLVGKVTYDGFESLPNDSILNVGGPGGAAAGGDPLASLGTTAGVPNLALLGGGAVVLAGVALVVHRLRDGLGGGGGPLHPRRGRKW